MARYLPDTTHPTSVDDVGASQPPVHRLPYDDLHLIFSMCWDPGDDTFPITVSHVCRRWRLFILEMPGFWSHVRFRHREPRLSTERYATWIQRSKDAPLNIVINDKPLKESTTRNVKAIMKLIGPHTQRWRSFEIERAPLQTIRAILDHLGQGSLPKLEYLRIVEYSNGFRGPGEPEWGSLGRLVLDVPHLQDLELVGVVADFNSPLFHNLKTLYLEDEYFEQLEPQTAKDIIHQLLQQSPHLKRLQLQNPRTYIRLLHRSPPPLPLTIEDPLSHSHLVELTLNLPRTAYDAIIPSVKLSALRSLHSPRKSKVTLDSWHLQSLARISPFPSLKQVDLCGYPSDLQYNMYLPGALATLTSLEELGLEQFDMTQVANAFPTLGHSCPQLNVLHMYSCANVDLSEIRVLVDRRLRADGMTALRNVRILGGVDDALPELREIEKWIREHVEHMMLFTEGEWNEYAHSIPSLRSPLTRPPSSSP